MSKIINQEPIDSLWSEAELDQRLANPPAGVHVEEFWSPWRKREWAGELTTAQVDRLWGMQARFLAHLKPQEF